MILDNRGFEPPQPMMRTMEALEKIPDGGELTIINNRRPMFLYPELDQLGYKHETKALEDGSYQITIRKPKKD